MSYRQQIIEKMAAHLDAQVRAARHEDEWEPERIADELLDIVEKFSITPKKESDEE